jgi:hypothetical protein
MIPGLTRTTAWSISRTGEKHNRYQLKQSWTSTATALVTGRFAAGIGRSAAALYAGASQHKVYHSRGATDTRFHGNGMNRTIFTTGAAFHTGIAVFYHHVLFIHHKHLMRTNIKAHTATGAFVFVQLQGDNIFKINRIFHFYSLSN